MYVYGYTGESGRGGEGGGNEVGERRVLCTSSYMYMYNVHGLVHIL